MPEDNVRSEEYKRLREELYRNRRAEWQCVREEMYRADRTCVTLLTSLATITVAVVSAASEYEIPFAAWALSPTWFLGFCYFTEKRFVIIRNAAYLRKHVEDPALGLGWESHVNQLSKCRLMRPALPFDPYHLELAVCSCVVLCVPIVGTKVHLWSIASLQFISSMVVAVGLLLLLVRALAFYGLPQEYEELPRPFFQLVSESVRKTWIIWLVFFIIWAGLPQVLWIADF